MLRNSKDAYGTVAKAFHWIIALLVLGLLSVGVYMTAIDFSPFKLQLYGLHKSFGLLVLALVVLRLLWRASNPKPKELSTHTAQEKKLAKLAHFFLYVLLFAMPLSGWVMSSAGDFPIPFFGLFEMPDVAAKDKTLFDQTRFFHTVGAYSILALIALHMTGAFKHHFVDGDDTLKRMTSRSVGFLSGAILALTFGVLLAMPFAVSELQYLKEDASAAKQAALPTAEIETETVEGDVAVRAVPTWLIMPDESTINFEATQYGKSFNGTFKEFDGTIAFDPENLAESRVDIKVDISSIDTGSADRDQQARGSDWFNVADYQAARFISESFTKIEANRYEAQGELTLRGVTLPLTLPFTLEISEKGGSMRTARMAAQITLQRLDYGIGQGQWKTADAIGNQVLLDIQVTAQAQ